MHRSTNPSRGRYLLVHAWMKRAVETEQICQGEGHRLKAEREDLRTGGPHMHLCRQLGLGLRCCKFSRGDSERFRSGIPASPPGELAARRVHGSLDPAQPAAGPGRKSRHRSSAAPLAEEAAAGSAPPPRPKVPPRPRPAKRPLPALELLADEASIALTAPNAPAR